MVNRIGERAIRTPQIMNEMVNRVSSAARTKVMAFRSTEAVFPVSNIVAQQVKRSVFYHLVAYEDNEPFFFGGQNKLENVTDDVIRNTLMQFSQQRLNIMAAFTEVLRAETEEGRKWDYAETISMSDPVAMMALTFKGSILHRNFDGTGASIFHYERIPGKESLGFSSPFSGKLLDDVAVGRKIKVGATEDKGLQTSDIFQLALLQVRGPLDIEDANGTWELMAGVLKRLAEIDAP